jgi:hypothetical protein
LLWPCREQSHTPWQWLLGNIQPWTPCSCWSLKRQENKSTLFFTKTHENTLPSRDVSWLQYLDCRGPLKIMDKNCYNINSKYNIGLFFLSWANYPQGKCYLSSQKSLSGAKDPGKCDAWPFAWRHLSYGGGDQQTGVRWSWCSTGRTGCWGSQPHTESLNSWCTPTAREIKGHLTEMISYWVA